MIGWSAERNLLFHSNPAFCAVRWCRVVVVFTCLALCFPTGSRGQTPAGGSSAVQLEDLVTHLRQENKLVGLATMVMVDGKVVDSAVDGERKSGSGVKLEIGDRWHLGSITKSITATMIARLVESGQMKWTDTIADCFPDASIHEDWKPVTVRQLLTHTAGAPDNFSFWVRLKSPEPGPESTKARRKSILDVLADKPLHPPGEKFSYSNVGYTIAGAIAEKATGLSWEDLVKQQVFEPLKLSSGGFGPPESSAEKLEQPRGHINALFGWKLPADDDDDNTPVMGPAGTVHMTLKDLCTYATEHLNGGLGRSGLLAADTWKQLHEPELNQYACGWIRKETSAEIPHAMYWHNGSNTMWYALVVFVPEKKMVVAVTSNDGDIPAAEAAAWEIVDAYSPTGRYPKKSPFAAVRWQDSRPEIKLGSAWFRLISLNELPVAEILEFSQRTYGEKWRKRFEEDLVELLTRMGHKPQHKVSLVVQSLTSSEMWVRNDVPVTKANRDAIKAAAVVRTIVEPSGRRLHVDHNAVSISDTVQFQGRADEFLELAHINAGFSGVVVVARKGRPVYQGAIGVSHLEAGTANSMETPFRIASLSKQFTAAAVLFLEGEGRLNVNDPVSQYLPAFAAAPYEKITIYHLLTHTSGLPRVPEDEVRRARWTAMSKAPSPVSDYVQLACECPLKFEPGQGRQYSNFGYRVLSAVIEKITDQPYADFMEQALFQRLGLKHTGVARISQPAQEAGVAEGLLFTGLNADTGRPNYAAGRRDRNYGAGHGSGGIYTSAGDLVRWDRVLAGDEFLSAAQKEKLFRPFRENYACGWRVEEAEPDGHLLQSHSGANEGYFSRMVRIPRDDLAIIALGNVPATEEIDDVVKQLFRLCRSLPYRSFEVSQK